MAIAGNALVALTLTNHGSIAILKRKSVGTKKDRQGPLDMLLHDIGSKHYKSHGKHWKAGRGLARGATSMEASIPGLCPSYFDSISKVVNVSSDRPNRVNYDLA